MRQPLHGMFNNTTPLKHVWDWLINSITPKSNKSEKILNKYYLTLIWRWSNDVYQTIPCMFTWSSIVEHNGQYLLMIDHQLQLIEIAAYYDC